MGASAASKFDIHDILNKRSQEMAKNENDQTKIVMVDVEKLIPSEQNFYHVDAELKESIELCGLLQPLLVRECEDGYHIIAGHRRHLAIKELVDEGKTQFAKVPVVFYKSEYDKENNGMDALSQLALIYANKFREKTDWERMKEVIESEKLIQKLRDEVPELRGKTRELLSQLLDVSASTVAKQKAISNNLSKKLMDEFQKGHINVSVAYEVSTLNEEQQEDAYNILTGCGALSLQDIRAIKTPVVEEPEMPQNAPVTEDNHEAQNVSRETFIEETRAEIKREEEDTSGSATTSTSTAPASTTYSGNDAESDEDDGELQEGHPTQADYDLEEAEKSFRDGNRPSSKDDLGADAGELKEYSVTVTISKTISAYTKSGAESNIRNELKKLGYEVEEMEVTE